MLQNRYSQLRAVALMVIIGVSLVACGGEADPPATPVSTVASPTAQSDVPTEVVLVDQPTEEFPTPDVEKKLAEMAPTAVIVEGQHPIPTAGADADGDGTYSRDEFIQALTTAYPHYSWPDAYHPSLEFILGRMQLNTLPQEAQFEIPAELTVIGSYHQCAWEQNWLDAFAIGDQQAMDQSMKQLRAVPLTNPNFRYIIHDLERIYNQAELGDPAPLTQFVQANCDWLNTFESSSQHHAGDHQDTVIGYRAISPQTEVRSYS